MDDAIPGIVEYQVGYQEKRGQPISANPLMRKGGLEPPQRCHHWNLNPKTSTEIVDIINV